MEIANHLAGALEQSGELATDEVIFGIGGG